MFSAKRALSRRWITDTAAETQLLGRHIGRRARPPLVIALSGPVGSGKTTFVKGIAQGMGISPDEVHSPSFVLVREYAGPRQRLCHADCYRLCRPASLVSLGLEEYITSGSVLVIEWPTADARRLCPDYVDIRLSVAGRSRRAIRMRARGTRAAGLLTRMKRLK